MFFSRSLFQRARIRSRLLALRVGHSSYAFCLGGVVSTTGFVALSGRPFSTTQQTLLPPSQATISVEGEIEITKTLAAIEARHKASESDSLIRTEIDALLEKCRQSPELVRRCYERVFTSNCRQHVTWPQYKDAIRLLCKHNSFDSAFRVFDHMVSSGVEPTCHTELLMIINMFASSLEHQLGAVDRVCQLRFGSKRARNLLERMIFSHARACDSDAVVKVASYMGKVSSSPCKRTINNALRGYLAALKRDKPAGSNMGPIMHIFEHLWSMGARPDSTTFELLARLFSTVENVDFQTGRKISLAFNQFKASIAHGSGFQKLMEHDERLERTCKAMESIPRRLHHLNQSLVQRMSNQKIDNAMDGVPSPATVRAVSTQRRSHARASSDAVEVLMVSELLTALQTNQIRRAETFMKKMISNGFHITDSVLQNFREAYAKDGDFDRLLALRTTFQKRSISFKEDVLYYCVREKISKGDLRKAGEYLDVLASEGFSPCHQAYNELLKEQMKYSMENALQTVTKMRARRVTECDSVRMFVDVYAANKMYDEILGLFQTVPDSYFPDLDCDLYSKLIMNAKQPSTVGEIFRLIRKQRSGSGGPTANVQGIFLSRLLDMGVKGCILALEMFKYCGHITPVMNTHDSAKRFLAPFFCQLTSSRDPVLAERLMSCITEFSFRINSDPEHLKLLAEIFKEHNLYRQWIQCHRAMAPLRSRIFLSLPVEKMTIEEIMGSFVAAAEHGDSKGNKMDVSADVVKTLLKHCSGSPSDSRRKRVRTLFSHLAAAGARSGTPLYREMQSRLAKALLKETVAESKSQISKMVQPSKVLKVLKPDIKNHSVSSSIGTQHSSRVTTQEMLGEPEITPPTAKSHSTGITASTAKVLQPLNGEHKDTKSIEHRVPKNKSDKYREVDEPKSSEVVASEIRSENEILNSTGITFSTANVLQPLNGELKYKHESDSGEHTFLNGDVPKKSQLLRGESDQHQLLNGESDQHQLLNGESDQHQLLNGESHQHQLLNGESDQHQFLNGESHQHQVLNGESDQHQLLNGESHQHQLLNGESDQHQHLNGESSDVLSDNANVIEANETDLTTKQIMRESVQKVELVDDSSPFCSSTDDFKNAVAL
eukprot:413667_1